MGSFEVKNKTLLIISILLLFLASCNGKESSNSLVDTTPGGSGSGDTGGGDTGGGGGNQSFSCPNDYIYISANSEVETEADFCVMKYEAKNNGSDIPVSTPEGNPYTLINLSNAKTKCTGLGTGYDLMSNAEWMTIAREIESVSANYEGGVLPRGWSRPGNSGPPPSTDSDCLFNTSIDVCSSSGDHVDKRTHILSNNQEIWDFAGGVNEWVSWNQSSLTGPTNCSSNWNFIEFTSLNTVPCYSDGGLLDYEVLPYTTNGSSAQGFGRFLGGVNGAAVRGGNWNDGLKAGVFTLIMAYHPNGTDQAVGFRCVYRGPQ